MKRGGESGQATLLTMIWLLTAGLALVVMWLSFGYLTQSANTVERTVQETANSAGTAAMTPATLAQGDPQLDPTLAEQKAESLLATNLDLVPGTFAPGSWSPFASTPQIQVVVSNGPFPAQIAVPFTGTVLTENYPTIVVAIQGDLRNWMGQAVPNTYWAASRIYEPGAPP